MSTIKVNTITTESGSTVTLGESGKTIALACGASQTGFGRTGTVDWCTTAKTSPLTAVSGKGYMVNTCGGAITVTLPSSPSAGDIVSIADYKNTFATNNVTIGRGGSKINGVCEDAFLNTEGQSATLVYIDGTRGWKTVQDSTSNITGLSFISASGGNSCGTSGNYKWHKFTADGTLTVSSIGTPGGEGDQISYMVVAGGGGGSYGSPGDHTNGGGGAGGYREGKNSGDPYTASPLDSGTALTVSATTYPITVGAGGSGAPNTSNYGGSGGNSVFSTITSAGGGGGGRSTGTPYIGQDGGSGGGGPSQSSGCGGTGNTPPTSPAQGTNGGDGLDGPTPNLASGGGGGATAAGTTATSGQGGNGGTGATSSIDATPTQRAGGGAGGSNATPGTATGGGGAASGTKAGTVNTGGGGGSSDDSCSPGVGGAGGSGIVVVRYRYQ